MQPVNSICKKEAPAPQNFTDILINHPLITAEVLLPTMEIRRLCDDVHKTILLRHQGLYFNSKSGMGKTSALTYLYGYLIQEIPKLAIIQHNGQNQEVPSVRAFFKFYLDSAGSTMLRGETADLKIRLFRRLADMARTSGLNMVVLLIDEAQTMQLQDFKFLKDIANELTKEKATLITILMAQEPDFSRVVADIKDAARLDLISRFLMRKKTYRGFSEEEHFRSLFTMIDSELNLHSIKTTWTEFFVPQAYQAGFRLANNTVAMMKELFEISPESVVEFPTRQIFCAIREFLLSCHHVDSPKMSFSRNLWRAAILEAEVQEALLIAAVEGNIRKGA